MISAPDSVIAFCARGLTAQKPVSTGPLSYDEVTLQKEGEEAFWIDDGTFEVAKAGGEK
jgi:hypothetical protein